MKQVYAALVIHIIGGHILQANLVVDAVAGTAYGCHDIGSWSNSVRDIGANLHHTSKVLVTGDEEVAALRCLAIFGFIDLFIGAINAHTENLHQYSFSA